MSGTDTPEAAEFVAFVDAAAGSGDVYPPVMPGSHDTEIGRFPFDDRIPGDKERAYAEARAAVHAELYVPVVAVYLNRAAREGRAFLVDEPTGNWRGSKEGHWSLVAEFSFDPAVPESHKAALAQARRLVQSHLEETEVSSTSERSEAMPTVIQRLVQQQAMAAIRDALESANGTFVLSADLVEKTEGTRILETDGVESLLFEVRRYNQPPVRLRIEAKILD
jgi:hypothetical protein